MTRKHFRAIAAALRRTMASRATVRAVADALRMFNPRFDYMRFEHAALDDDCFTPPDGK